MRTLPLKWLGFGLLPTVAVLVACSSEPDVPQLTVTDTMIMANPVEGRPSAAYFTVYGGAKPVQLISVNVTAAMKTELHSTTTNKGVMSMAPVGAVTIPAGGKVEFKQGGYHAMIYGLPKYALDNGETSMLFGFSDGSKFTIKTKVAKAGSADHH